MAETSIIQEIKALLVSGQYERALELVPQLQLAIQRGEDENLSLERRVHLLKKDVEMLKEQNYNLELSIKDVADSNTRSQRSEAEAEWQAFVAGLGNQPDAVEKAAAKLNREHADILAKTTRLAAAMQQIPPLPPTI